MMGEMADQILANLNLQKIKSSSYSVLLFMEIEEVPDRRGALSKKASLNAIQAVNTEQ